MFVAPPGFGAMFVEPPVAGGMEPGYGAMFGPVFVEPAFGPPPRDRCVFDCRVRCVRDVVR
jgi:hypothetical protein